MQPFDYNKYLKNNPLLREFDDEGSGYSYEYQEGPGASPQEIARTIKQFQSDKFTWEKLAKNDFYAMAQGNAADIKSDYYPDWKKSDFEQVINAIEGSTSLNEAFAANSKLANALNFLKKNAGTIYDDNPEIMSALEAVRATGLTSRDVFSFASMFPRDSFKVDDIRTGKLEAQVDRIHFDGSEMLNKAKALRSFVLAFDNYYHGDKNWYKGY